MRVYTCSWCNEFLIIPRVQAEAESENCSIVSDSLRPHGLYSPRNSPGQNTGVGSFPFSRGSSQPRDWTQVSHTAGGFFTSWATREAQEYWVGSLSLLQRISPNQGLNWGLLHCRWILYQPNYEGSQKKLSDLVGMLMIYGLPWWFRQ